MLTEGIPVKIKEISSASDAALVASLAACIWTEHYTPIIGEGQVSYMLEKFQSAGVILRDISEGRYKYYVACKNGAFIAYCAIKTEKDGSGPASSRSMFLSKLYVEEPYRGKGIAGRFIGMLKNMALKEGFDFIWLTVNKNNIDSIAAYKKMGFSVIGEIVTDIGGGYVMDDYKMRMDIVR